MDNICTCPCECNYVGHFTPQAPASHLIIKEFMETVPNVGSGGGGGIKHDQDKPDFTYISYELLESIAKVRKFGEKKYSRNNWKKGFKVTRSCAAALRHIFAFVNGETNDPESGECHLAHAVCCLEHAIYDMKRHKENDDRETE